MFERIKELYSFAREHYNKPRYILNYFVLPIFAGFSILDLIVCFILLSVSREKFLIASLVMFSLLLAGAIACLIVLPLVVKSQEVKAETKRVTDFFEASLNPDPNCNFMLTSSSMKGTLPLTFAKEGMQIGQKAYKYSEYECALYTSNYLYHANLIVVFTNIELAKNPPADDAEDDDQTIASFSLSLDTNLLSIIEKFEIKLANAEVLAFIKDQPKKAVRQILSYGKVQKDYDKYKTR